ncbi:hypothetical protein ACFYZ5_27330 [Streptomyces chartreusis]|uniref:hypothetical protein n=1 Tax=Streptomyces chartreusis TaxID=1969 RepID=UPI00367DD5DD
MRQEDGGNSPADLLEGVDDFDFDVGVVFVHGIGSQAQGATLLSWAEPLLEVLSHVGPRYDFSPRVVTADDLVGDAPEITLEISRPGSRPTTWLLSEARWAEAFHPSRASDVLLWAARFSWRAARRGLAALFHQLWFSTTKRLFPQILRQVPIWRGGCAGALSTLAEWVPLLVYGWVSLVVMLVPYLVMFCVLFFFAPVMLCVAVAGVIALIVAQRLPVLGKRVSPFVADLVTSVGDAQAYRDREIQAAAMRQVLLTRVTDATRRARNVVVVAHSQGAAIACRTFLAGDARWPECLVTVGAATSLLNEEKSVGRWQSLGCPPWINIWSSRDLVPAGPIGDSTKAARSRWMETLWHYTAGGFIMRSPDGRLELAWKLGSGPDCWSGSESLVQQARNARGRRTNLFWGDETAEAVETPEPFDDWLRWEEAEDIAEAVLFRATGERVEPEDVPIPRDFDEPGPEEWPVANRWSIFWDHTAYSTNLTQVQYPLIYRLLCLSEATAGERDDSGDPAAAYLPPQDGQVEATHVGRVRVLAMSRVIAAVSAVAVVDWLIGSDAERWLSEVGSWTVGGSRTGSWVSHRLGQGLWSMAVLAMVGLAAFAAFSGLLRFAWQGWHRRESLRLCATPDGPTLRLGIIGCLLAALYTLGLVSSVLYWGRGLFLPSPEWSDPRFLLVLTYVAWVTLWPVFGMCATAVPARPGPSR